MGWHVSWAAQERLAASAYSRGSTDYRIDLTDDNAENGAAGAEGDLLRGFENVVGGHGPDAITGTKEFNIIYAGEGNDTIDGNGQDDQIFAQAGNDRIILKTQLPTYPSIDGGSNYDVLDMIGGSYSFADDAAGHGLEEIDLSQISALSFGATQHLYLLNISGSSGVTLQPDSHRVLHLHALNIATDSFLDLRDNGMILDAADIGAVANLIKLGRDSDSGIVAFRVPNHSLGIRSNAGPLYSEFLGEGGLSGSEILVLYTILWDLNLDRQVSISDFIDLASHFGQTPAVWGEGDIDYDGSVSIGDFIDLSSNFGQSFSGAASPQAPLSNSITVSPIAKKRTRAKSHHRKARRPASAVFVPARAHWAEKR